MSGEVERWQGPQIPVVRRANQMAAAASAVRLAREQAILATPLPTAEADEVLVLIFHRVFRAPQEPDRFRRYTYVATYRHEVGKWYLSHDARHRSHRAYTNRELLLFAQPIGPPTRVFGNEVPQVLGGYTPSPIPVPRVQVWFLPTQASR